MNVLLWSGVDYYMKILNLLAPYSFCPNILNCTSMYTSKENDVI